MRRQVTAGVLGRHSGRPAVIEPATLHLDGDRIVAIDRSTSEDRPRDLALPAPVNAHDHLRAIRTSAMCAWGLPFELWSLAINGMPRLDPYLAAIVALGRSALGGAGSVMVHYTRPQGGTDLATEAAEVCRAARDVGVRIAFAVALRDRNMLAYEGQYDLVADLPADLASEVQARFMAPAPSPSRQLDIVEEVAARCGGPLVDIQYGPVGVQWCSDALLRAVAEASATSGRRVHMHLLETLPQRRWADRRFPDGVVDYLDDIGLLSPRLSVAHCVWARPEELALLADRGVRLVTNASSNLVLHSGRAPTAAAMSANLPLAIGVDGLALDDDDDVLREIRLAYLQASQAPAPSVPGAEAFIEACCDGGRHVVGAPPGEDLAVGAPADILLLDRSRLAGDLPVPDRLDADLIVARARKEHIRGLIVAGRDVVVDGRLARVDLADAEAVVARRIRDQWQDFAAWQDRLAPLRTALAARYAEAPPPGQ